MKTIQCVGCKGEFPEVDGPVHRYMESCPGCWAAFGEVLNREYSNPTYFSVHRLSVDAYAVQHPGTPSRQSIQSVGLHLIRLCLFLDHGLSEEIANAAMLEAAKWKHSFEWLEPPPSLGDITVANVIAANNAEEHKDLVRSWAETAWDAWSVHHITIRERLTQIPLGPQFKLSNWNIGK